MSINFTSSGFDRVHKRLESTEGKLRYNMVQAIEKCLVIVEKRAQSSGYVPVLTHALQNSIRHEITKIAKDMVEGEVIAGDPANGVTYAYYQEFGSVKNIKTLFMTRAGNDSMPQIMEILNKAIREV